MKRKNYDVINDFAAVTNDIRNVIEFKILALKVEFVFVCAT